MDAETLKVADEVREYMGQIAIVQSGARCLLHNREIGSNDASQHVKCRAMDLRFIYPTIAYNWLCNKYPDQYGFGLYSWGVHIDTRSGPKARWQE